VVAGVSLVCSLYSQTCGSQVAPQIRLIGTPLYLNILKTVPVIEKKPNRDIPIINERIRFPKVRVIDSDGSQLGIMSSREALQMAEDKELDLVLVSDKADPPVCKIVDYGKHKFEQEKKAKEAKKKQHTVDVKEVKMRYKIEEHDYNVRINQAERFLKAGDKVKATIMFRGREIQHSDLAEELLKRMATDLQELAEVQQAPKKEGRNMMMLLAPKK
jgi:translation initiation factor IF-3